VSAESPAQLLDRLQLWSQRSTTLRDEDLGDICFTEAAHVSDAHPVPHGDCGQSVADLREKLEEKTTQPPTRRIRSLYEQLYDDEISPCYWTDAIP